MVPTKHKGAHSELVATAWLIEQGYEVFRNVSQHGAVDLIYRDPASGALTPVDVTTGSVHTRQDGSRCVYFAKNKLGKGPRVLVVTDGQCAWAEQPPPARPRPWLTPLPHPAGCVDSRPLAVRS